LPSKEVEVRKGRSQESTHCPECSRPYTYFPPPHNEPKKYFGLPLWVILIVIIVIFIPVVFVFFIVGPFLTFFDPSETVETDSFDVTILEGGHYKYTIEEYYHDDMDIELEVMSKSGTEFDVYIMEEDQYRAAYGGGSSTMMAFSSKYAQENVFQVSGEVSIPEGSTDGLYLVIDNKQTDITDGDADPEGPIEVNVRIKTTMYIQWD
jgi:hypothetical protein